MTAAMDQAPRVLHVLASLRGGAAEHVLHLMEHFSRLGHNLHLAAPDDCPATAEKLQALNIVWHKLPLDQRFCRPAQRYLKEMLLSGRIDILHTHGIRGGYHGRCALAQAKKQGAGAKSVYTVHGFHPAYYASSLLRRGVCYLEKRFFLRSTDCIIFVSESDRNAFQRHVHLDREILEKRSALIPNGIHYLKRENLPDRRMCRKMLGLSPESFVVGTASRLNYQKAVHLLIQAAAKLMNHELPRLEVLIAGDGPLEKELKSLANRLGASSRIHFLGYYAHADAFYAALDCFVLSSRWEGLPLVLLEAGGLGMPMVASRVPGSDEVIEQDVTGLFFKSGEMDDLADQLLYLELHPDEAQRLGQNAASIIPARFSLEKMLEKTAQVYDNVLSDLSRHR